MQDADAKQIGDVAACLEYIFMSKDKRRMFTNWLCEKESLKEMDKKLVAALHRWLKPVYSPEATAYIPRDEHASAEANAALDEYLRQSGQIELPLENGQ